MFIFRVLCKKRFLCRLAALVIFFMFLQLYWLSKYDGRFSIQGNKYAAEMAIPNPTAVKQSVCSNTYGDDVSEADVYTFDLPEITNYSFVTGKRFKEYVIPVKTEKEAAYGPDLDPVTILIIPFSHVDPGYGNTMEGYYSSKTKSTLNYMVPKLEEHRDMTFQWAEVVFLERWWRDISTEMKQRFRDLVQRGQIEIVLGGWVMPDEASTHYMAVIDQLIEGHQWVHEQLKVKPRNSWSNDPFGFSSTMPYLWKKSGMDNMVILRIHQAIKATLMKKKTMEFNWRQPWSKNPDNEILCHLMPYRGYWIGDTCGPYNQHICREYAFMHENPIDKVVWLTDANLKERARILYEQYRITAEIFRRHDTTSAPDGKVQLYVPMFLGEDFSFTSAKDYELIHQNYKRLMDFINAQSEWKMTVKFGTLKEYFKHVRDFQEKRTTVDQSRFPTLAGDFFPYSDYQNDYWTGYYTTRPFNKQMSRELQAIVRTADIFHSYAMAYSRNGKLSYDKNVTVSKSIQVARRELGMFLHHDGITGTSVRPVVTDFQTRLFNALNTAKEAMHITTSSLLGIPRSPTILLPTMTRKTKMSLSQNNVISVQKSASKLVIANPSGRDRREVISFVTDSCITVENPISKEYVKVQTNQLDENQYRSSFVANLSPFGIQTYSLKKYSGCDINVPESEQSNDISIENDYIRAEFNETGFLKAIKDKITGQRTNVVSEILVYTSKRSGAYIFAPTGPASSTFQKTKPTSISVVKGSLSSEVKVTYPGFTMISTLFHVKESQGKGVHIRTMVDMGTNNLANKELIIRFKTDIDSSNTFYTDQNGFQLLKRKTYPKRAIEENYYPLTTMALVEDFSRRFTVHLAQPLGGASLESGAIEIMLDRRVTRDDAKGLGQGVTDNVPTIADFAVSIEHFDKSTNGKPNNRKYTYASATSQLLNERLIYPVYTMFIDDESKLAGLDLKHSFNPMTESLPCGLSVVGLRTLVTEGFRYKGTSLILHKLPVACGFQGLISECENDEHSFSLEQLFPDLGVSSAEETTLTHLDSLGDISSRSDLHPLDNELRSFQIVFELVKKAPGS